MLLIATSIRAPRLTGMRSMGAPRAIGMPSRMKMMLDLMLGALSILCSQMPSSFTTVIFPIPVGISSLVCGLKLDRGLARTITSSNCAPPR